MFFSQLTERDRETIEELSAALRDEKSRAEEIQVALTNEKRQTEALKHAKDRADQLRHVNKGNSGCLPFTVVFTSLFYAVLRSSLGN